MRPGLGLSPGTQLVLSAWPPETVFTFLNTDSIEVARRERDGTVLRIKQRRSA